MERLVQFCFVVLVVADRYAARNVMPEDGGLFRQLNPDQINSGLSPRPVESSSPRINVDRFYRQAGSYQRQPPFGFDPGQMTTGRGLMGRHSPSSPTAYRFASPHYTRSGQMNSERFSGSYGVGFGNGYSRGTPGQQLLSRLSRNPTMTNLDEPTGVEYTPRFASLGPHPNLFQPAAAGNVPWSNTGVGGGYPAVHTSDDTHDNEDINHAELFSDEELLEWLGSYPGAGHTMANRLENSVNLALTVLPHHTSGYYPYGNNAANQLDKGFNGAIVFIGDNSTSSTSPELSSILNLLPISGELKKALFSFVDIS